MEIKMKQKKGLSLNDAFPAVLTVAVVALLIVTLLYMFTQLATVPADIARTKTSESVAVTNAGTAVANSTNCGFNNFAVTTATNASGTLIAAGNYSVSASAGTIRNLTAQTGSTSSPWTVNYTFTDKGDTCIAAQTTVTQYTTQIPLVGLILAIVLIAIVIGVLVSSFFAKSGGRV